MDKIPVIRQNSDELDRFLDGAATFADVLWGFLDESTESSEANCGDDELDPQQVEENRVFWETQEKNFEATLFGTTSIETKIRQATKDAIKDLNSVGILCACRRPESGDCRRCFQRELSILLQKAGFNCSLCKSKWKSSPEIPAGEHTYLEVMEKSKKGDEVRVVIELNLRGEFEMAKGNVEYDRIINRMPELFVGKAERLKTLIKILCTASKKCMKDKNMHLAPWRSRKYMQAKWLGKYEKTSPVQLPMDRADRLEKPKSKTSMLTFDLRSNLAGAHCTAVAVV